MGTSEARLGKNDEYGMGEYSSIDIVAIFALLLGIASAGAVVFSSLFLGVAFFALVAGVGSLIRINRADGILAGRWLAIAGMGLAIFFGFWQVSYSRNRDQTIQEISRGFAEDWLEMVRTGKYNEAHQLTLGFFERVVPGTNLSEHYAEKKDFDQLDVAPDSMGGAMKNLSGTPFDQREDLFRRPILSEIRNQGTNCKIDFVEHVTTFRKGKFMDYAVHRFKVTYPENGQDKEESFLITMKREAYKEPFGVQWAVDMLDNERTKIDRTRGM